jgi:hypothetical protein
MQECDQDHALVSPPVAYFMEENYNAHGVLQKSAREHF